MPELMFVQCCVCKKLRIKHGEVEVWMIAVPPVDALISSTYCPECMVPLLKEIEEM